MNTYKLLAQTFESLLKQKFRTFLSVLGIIIGVAAVIAMLAIGEGAKREILRQMEQLGINNIIIRHMDPKEVRNNGASPGLTPLDTKALENSLPGVNVTASKTLEAKLSNLGGKLNEEVVAVTPNYRDVRNLSLAEGRFLCDLDVKQHSLVCVIGHEIGKNLGALGHDMGRLDINQQPFRVIGVLGPRETQKGSNIVSTQDYNNVVFIPHGTEGSVEKGTSSLYRQLHEIVVKVPSKKHLGPYAKIVKTILLKNHHGIQDFQIVVPLELLNQQQKAQRTFRLVLSAIAAISLLVGGVGIMNIMLAIITERTKEIGIRRALGASQRHIMSQFLVETLVLTSIGSLLGLTAGIAAAFLISTFSEWSAVVSLWSVVVSICVSVLVGILSGLYPAYKAAYMDPILALRHE